MFWENQTSQIHFSQSILDNEDIDKISLEELIDKMPNLVNEYDVGNEKLITILKRRDILESLIKHVTETPSDHLNENDRFKYANSSCVLFSSKSSEMENELIQQTDLLDRLLSFLDTDENLNPLMASFFANTLFSIYTKFNEQMIDYFNSKPDFFDLFFKHIQISGIMDFLFKVFTLEAIPNKRFNDVYQWLNSQNIIKRIVNVFKIDDNQNALENASYLLTYLISKGRQSIINLDEEKKFYQFYNDSFLTELVEICLSHKASVIHILRVLVQFADYENHFKIIDGIKSKFDSPDSQLEISSTSPLQVPSQILKLIGTSVGAVSYEYLSSIKNLHKVMLLNLDKFKELLIDSVPDYSVLTTTGLLEKPLGFVRLEIIHLFYALLQANNPEIDEAFAKNHILEVLIDLFFEYEYNSFLHNHVNNIIITIFLNANDNRFKLLTNEQDRTEFLSLNSLDKWKEKQMNLIQMLNYVWSDRECSQHINRIIENEEFGDQLVQETEDVEFRDQIVQEVNQFINQLLKNQSTIKTRYSSLIGQLFNECNLLERVMNKYKSIANDKLTTKPIPTHKSNLIDFAKIMNRFLNEYQEPENSLPVELIEKTNYLKLKDDWQIFASTELVSVDNKIIEAEQSIKNQQSAEKCLRKFVFHNKEAQIKFQSPYNPEDYKLNRPSVSSLLQPDTGESARFARCFERKHFFESFSENLLEKNTELSEQFKASYLNLMNEKIKQNKFNLIIDDQQFDETNRIEDVESETDQSKLNLTKETEESKEISSLNEKDNLFEPIASSSNISNELNIPMECNFSSDEFEVDPFKKPSNPITTSEFENQGNEQKEEDSVFQATDNWADFTKERSEDSEN